MRDIKFRAWTDSGMQYDWLKIVIRPMSEVGGVSLSETVGASISTSTAYYVMQYTGLTDKSGKGIYEGDVIEDDWGYIASVRYDNNAASFVLSDGSIIGDYNPGDITIIGNIYQNPELLNA